MAIESIILSIVIFLVGTLFGILLTAYIFLTEIDEGIKVYSSNEPGVKYEIVEVKEMEE